MARATPQFLPVTLLGKLGLFALFALPCACTTPPYCEAQGKCGGDFLGSAQVLEGTDVGVQEWVATVDDACIDQVPSPPEPPQLAYIPPKPSGVRQVEPTTIDWCSGLVLQNDTGSKTLVVKAFDDGWYETLKRYDGWFPSVPLYRAQVTFGQNNQYTASMTQLVSNHVEITKTCLIAQGVNPTCEDLNVSLRAFVAKRLEGIQGLNAVVYGDLPGCVSDGDGGCNCDYNVSLTSDAAGPWEASGGRISFFNAEAAPPGRADYCMNGGVLELSGTKGVDLFNRAALKTMTLHPPTCSDKVQSLTLGETDIDCGGSCGPCPE